MYETLDQIEEDVRKSLAEAVSNRRSPLHVPVVATADADLRMMVLRAFDADSWTLRLHTDARSPKVATIGAAGDAGAPVGLLFHDPEAKIQIRLRGTGRIVQAGVEADAAWAAASAFSRRCYLAQSAPGTPQGEPTSGLPPEVEGQRPSEAELAPARTNFAVLLVQVDSLDWLWLSHEGHRRARLERSGEGAWQGAFVTP